MLSPQRKAYRITVESLFLVPSSRGPLRSVAFHYSFPGIASVQVKGLGVIPGRGYFQYLTSETTIQFKNPVTNKSILTVSLDNPTRLMAGRNTIAIPARADFPAVYRIGRWPRTESFQQHVAKVLNGKFPSGFLVDGQTPIAFITSYRELEGIAAPLFARFAVMIEPVAPQVSTSAEFRVRIAAQERRSHTEWRAIDNMDAQKALLVFVNSLIRDLEGGVL